jgi:pimeloyl-ACP methyl ester carboxylesterase
MSQPRNALILLHGLGRSPLSMWRLARAARTQGYDVITPAYPSLKGTLADHINTLTPLLPRLKTYDKVHAIGHSLGGLVLRGLFTQPEAEGIPLGRFVFLGTPHKGAGLIQQHRWLFDRPQTPLIIHDLAPDSAALKNLGFPIADMGCVVGTARFHPLNPASWVNRILLGDTLHDGTVEEDSATLPNAKDIFRVPVNHSFLPLSGRVIDKTLHFIKHGSFS